MIDSWLCAALLASLQDRSDGYGILRRCLEQAVPEQRFTLGTGCSKQWRRVAHFPRAVRIGTMQL
jgi:hypothetical protein